VLQPFRNRKNGGIKIAYGEVVDLFAFADLLPDVGTKLYYLRSDKGFGKVAKLSEGVLYSVVDIDGSSFERN
jgi:hypothetical protein